MVYFWGKKIMHFKKYGIIFVTLGIITGCEEPLGPESPCVNLLKGNLLNPETFEIHDVVSLEKSQLDVVYKNAKSEEEAAVIVVKFNCIKPMSMKCLNAVEQWKKPIEKHRAVIKNIDELKSGEDNIKVFKLRTKAEGKLGNKITSFSLCAINNEKIFVTPIDG